MLDNKNEFNKACSSFVEQAGALCCFKCPSCAKAYISSTWFRRHLGRCPQPIGASTTEPNLLTWNVIFKLFGSLVLFCCVW